MTAPDRVPCPECEGSKTVWGEFHGFELEADCPYCGGSGTALRRAVERDYPDAKPVAP